MPDAVEWYKLMLERSGFRMETRNTGLVAEPVLYGNPSNMDDRQNIMEMRPVPLLP